MGKTDIELRQVVCIIRRIVRPRGRRRLIRRPPGNFIVGLQQTAIADYRQEVIDLLRERWGAALHIYVGVEYFDPTVMTGVRLPANTVTVTNRFLFRRRLEWQHGVVRPFVGMSSAVVELNPRILSTWVILILRRLLGRRTVVWGHAWSRSGASSRTEVARHAMRRLSTVVLVYTEQERRELAKRMPSAQIVAAPNALYRRRQIGAVQTDQRPFAVVYGGRMVPAKKPTLLVKAFLMATESGLPDDMRLLMIGDGPERSCAQQIATRHRYGDRVSFLGHVPAGEMGPFYARSLVSASPGYVGLSLIQSLSFGVPMLIARDEPHAPEFEAARPGANTVLVTSDSAEHWADALLKIADARDTWTSRRAAIAADCRDCYAVELMVDRIVEAATARVK